MMWPAALTALPETHGFTVPDNLFSKITDDQRADWAQPLFRHPQLITHRSAANVVFIPRRATWRARCLRRTLFLRVVTP